MQPQDHQAPRKRSCSDDLLPFALGGIGGAIVAAAAFLAYATLVEELILPTIRPPGPVLSYGQESAVSLFFVVVLGASGGSVVPVAFQRQARTALVLLLPLLASAVVCLLNTLAWRYCLGRYGQDVSDLITFVPPYVAAASALACSLLCGMSRILARSTL